MLNALDTTVPRRAEGRSASHREGYCIANALRWLSAQMPMLFPATLIRQEAPDFVLEPRAGQSWAFEHTDAGERHHQKWLADTEDAPGAMLLPSPSNAGWIGDAPERAFDQAVLEAVQRKSAPKFWRAAPVDAVRCILAYDQTNTRLFVGDGHAQQALERAIAQTPGFAVILVRGDRHVLVAGLKR